MGYPIILKQLEYIYEFFYFFSHLLSNELLCLFCFFKYVYIYLCSFLHFSHYYFHFCITSTANIVVCATVWAQNWLVPAWTSNTVAKELQRTKLRVAVVGVSDPCRVIREQPSMRITLTWSCFVRYLCLAFVPVFSLDLCVATRFRLGVVI